MANAKQPNALTTTPGLKLSHKNWNGENKRTAFPNAAPAPVLQSHSANENSKGPFTLGSIIITTLAFTSLCSCVFIVIMRQCKWALKATLANKTSML